MENQTETKIKAKFQTILSHGRSIVGLDQFGQIWEKDTYDRGSEWVKIEPPFTGWTSVAGNNGEPVVKSLVNYDLTQKIHVP